MPTGNHPRHPALLVRVFAEDDLWDARRCRGSWECRSRYFCRCGRWVGCTSGAGPNRKAWRKMINQSLKVTVVVAGLALLTAACGDRPVDRALTGGAIGAGSGAVIGSTVGNPIAGAVIGGAAGATIGAVTAPER